MYSVPVARLHAHYSPLKARSCYSGPFLCCTDLRISWSNSAEDTPAGIVLGLAPPLLSVPRIGLCPLPHLGGAPGRIRRGGVLGSCLRMLPVRERPPRSPCELTGAARPENWSPHRRVLRGIVL